MAGGELGRIAQRGDCLLDELDPIDRPKPDDRITRELPEQAATFVSPLSLLCTL
jgi:hypothetical protein